MANWSIPKRFVNIKLFRGTSQTEDNLLSSLGVDANISFNTSASYGGMAYEANVTIHGLTMEKMAYLATSYNAYTNNANRINSISIEAGYDNKHSLIYTGTIVDSSPSVDSADYSIELKCVSMYNYLSEGAESFSFKGQTDLKDICKTYAEKMGTALKYDINEPVPLTNYQINHSTMVNAIRDLAHTAGADIWVGNDGVMYVKKANKSLTGETYNIDYTNIIGSPKPDALGCDVNIRMDCTIKAGLKVVLASKKFPSINGNYFIQSFSHGGETRGNKWQTSLRLTKESIFAK